MKNEKDYCNNSRDCECVFWNYGKVCDYCYETNCPALVEYKPPTNYEKIKQMSIDEMAKCSIPFFNCPYDTPYVGCDMGKKYGDDCIKCTKAWLEQEVK